MKAGIDVDDKYSDIGVRIRERTENDKMNRALEKYNGGKWSYESQQ